MARLVGDVMEDLTVMAWEESNVVLNQDDLKQAISKDCMSINHYPTRQECEWLVMGKETDTGDYEVPEALQTKFPALHKLLDECMT